MSTILIYTLANFAGAFFFLFNYWRSLRQDKPSEEIFPLGFKYVFTVLLFGLSAVFLSEFLPDSRIYNKHELWFLTSLISFLIVFFQENRGHRKGFVYETLDVCGMGFLGWLGFIVLASFSLVPLVLIIFLFLIHKYISLKYKTFSWYKSGRVGLAGVITFAIFFTTRAIFAIVGGDIISFAGRIEIISSGLLAFLLYFSVYQLSQKT